MAHLHSNKEQGHESEIHRSHRRALSERSFAEKAFDQSSLTVNGLKFSVVAVRNQNLQPVSWLKCQAIAVRR